MGVTSHSIVWILWLGLYKLWCITPVGLANSYRVDTFVLTLKSNKNMSQELSPMSYEADLKQAVETLKKGGIILYPTDTVWGIGCDASNPDAVRRIYELKRRAESKSMIVLVHDLPMLERTVSDIPEVAYDMVELAVRPLTVIYDRAVGVAPNLLAEDGSLAVRLTRERFSRDLCKALRRPVVSTSANLSGEPTPAIYSAISAEIVEGVDYVVHYRREDRSTSAPSQIIKLSADARVQIIRE